MIKNLVVPMGGMAALAAASLYYGAPQIDQAGQSVTTPAAVVAAPNTAPPAPLPQQGLAGRSADLTVAARPDPAHRKVAAAQGPEENKARAAALHAADKEMQPAGFGAACFDQMRSVFCPIFGRIPVFREMAAQMATIGGFSCPMGTPPPAGT